MRHKVSESVLRASPRRAVEAQYPEPVPILPDSEEADTPFEEGAHDAIDPDLRHRMISEAAYYMYQQRGYVDGYDVDDWLQAEVQVDHMAIRHSESEVTTEQSPPAGPRRIAEKA